MEMALGGVETGITIARLTTTLTTIAVTAGSALVAAALKLSAKEQ